MAKTTEKAKKDKASDKRRQGREKTKAEKATSDKYTDPKLRSKLKDKIQAGTKGGKKGQWSARKAQLLVKQYEKAGGGYVDTDSTGKRKKSKGRSSSESSGKDERQKSLSTWTREEWQTKDGDTRAHNGDVTSRYLPEEALTELLPAEQDETEQLNESASASGQQFVPNTPQAKAAGRRARTPKASDGAASNETAPRTGTRKRQPLQGYDAMTIRDILAAMAEANVRSLRTVLSYEKANRNRKTLVPKLEKELESRS